MEEQTKIILISQAHPMPDEVASDHLVVHTLELLVYYDSSNCNNYGPKQHQKSS